MNSSVQTLLLRWVSRSCPDFSAVEAAAEPEPGSVSLPSLLGWPAPMKLVLLLLLLRSLHLVMNGNADVPVG